MRKMLCVGLLLALVTCGGCRLFVPSEARSGGMDFYIGSRQAIIDTHDGAESDGTPLTEAEKNARIIRHMKWFRAFAAFCEGMTAKELEAYATEQTGEALPPGVDDE